MQTNRAERQVRLFTLRLWTEGTTDDPSEWRGRIYDATTGDERYFREWASLIPLLLAMLRKTEPPSPPHAAPPGALGADA